MTEEQTVSIYQRLMENEALLKRFYAVEKKILSILSFKDFFEVLLTEIKEQFNIPFVWLSLLKNGSANFLIDSVKTLDESLKSNINLIEKNLFFALIGNQTEPVLANAELKPYFKLLPEGKSYLIKSMAIAPITMDGEVIGSLNHGDASENRFHPNMDTFLLEQLAAKVSLCLSNVTAHERLEFLAYHDPLTGLLNRRVMETVLKREIGRAKRYNMPLSVVFLDLDYFKTVNDTFGHEAGDRLLIHLARSLEQKSRETDIISRFAGDEFVIILPETGSDQANALMNRVKLHLEQTPLIQNGKEIPVSTSFGVASMEDALPEEDDAASILLKKADERLYQKKASRKTKATP
ncbi:MAG: sensor domain-containing diguanylate cyclase [Thermodesulfobacteriota bacterium]